MTALSNTTSYAASVFAFLDADAQERRVLIVSGTYDVLEDGSVQPSETPVPLHDVDEYHGEPSSSSLRIVGDLTPPKAAVDVLVYGSAIAPLGRSVNEVLTRLRVSNLDKSVLVTGNRVWQGGHPGRATAFQRMPLQYERSYGGTLPYCAANPVGVSADTDDKRAQQLGTHVPNLEYPNDRMASKTSRPRPAGYGPIAPWWAPRAQYAGTYDETWLREQSPLLPHDFDVRFHQTAPLDQQIDRLTAGAQVELLGMTVTGAWRFELPDFAVEVRLLFSQRSAQLEVLADTLSLRPDESRFTITARAVLPETRSDPVREIMVGPVTRGRWRSRLTGKPYLRRVE